MCLEETEKARICGKGERACIFEYCMPPAMKEMWIVIIVVSALSNLFSSVARGYGWKTDRE